MCFTLRSNNNNNMPKKFQEFFDLSVTSWTKLKKKIF